MSLRDKKSKLKLHSILDIQGVAGCLLYVFGEKLSIPIINLGRK